MDDVHGKEISLQYTTVKVPGQKPRGSRTLMGTQSSANQPHHHPADISSLSLNSGKLYPNALALHSGRL